MSGATFRRKTGLIFAVVALGLGMTATAALGWENEEKANKDFGKHEQEHGENQKEHGNKQKEQVKQEQQAPSAVVPPTQPTAPQPGAAPAPAPAPASPVTTQGAPTPAPEERASAESAPEETEQAAGKGREILAEEAAPLAPVAEQRKLAQTGLNPALIALLGAFSLVAGGFLFRRALVR
jgi:uncharacterized protein HemX